MAMFGGYPSQDGYETEQALLLSGGAGSAAKTHVSDFLRPSAVTI
jgi:hypothetical protein